MKKLAVLLCCLMLICAVGCSEESASKLNKTNTEAASNIIAEIDKHLDGQTNTGELALAITEHGQSIVYEANDNYTAFTEVLTELLMLIPEDNNTELKRVRDDIAALIGQE